MKKDLLKVGIRYMPSFGISGPGEGDPNTTFLDDDPVSGQRNFRVSAWTAQQFASTFTGNERQALLVAAQLYNRRLIAHEMRGGDPKLSFTDALHRVGRLEGNMVRGLQNGFVAEGKAEQDAFAAAVKDGESARILVTTLVGKGIGAGSIPAGMMPELLASTDELMTEQMRQKIDNSTSNAQTTGDAWADGVRESLAVSLHSDGTDRSSKVTVDGEEWNVDELFAPNGQLLQTLTPEQRDVLRRWGDEQRVAGATGETLKTWVETGFANTGAVIAPTPESGPPPARKS
jgi:hypothetical protein